MADLIVRPAEKDEFPAIRTLIKHVRINPTGLDWRRFLVAADPDGRIIGCGQVKPHADGSLELASIAVQKQSRGQGVARAIIERLLECEADRPIFLMCRARLESFYVRFGFQAITSSDEMPPYFRRIQILTRLFSKGQSTDQLMIMMLK